MNTLTSVQTRLDKIEFIKDQKTRNRYDVTYDPYARSKTQLLKPCKLSPKRQNKLSGIHDLNHNYDSLLSIKEKIHGR